MHRCTRSDEIPVQGSGRKPYIVYACHWRGEPTIPGMCPMCSGPTIEVEDTIELF